MDHIRKTNTLYTVLATLLTAFLLSSCSSDSDSTSGNDNGTVFRHLSTDIDNNADGTINRQFITIYDTQGLATGELIDDGFDGIIDNETTYTYQDNRLSSVSFDDGRDGTINSVTEYNYNSDGVLLSTELREPPDGPIISRVDYNQDSSGVLTGTNADLNLDGSIDEVGSYTYTDFGTISAIEFDTDVDGTTDITISFTYGDSGEALTRTRSLADGTVTDLWTYVYEAGPCDTAGEFQPPIVTCFSVP